MPADPSAPQRSLASRLAWFVVLWLVGVSAVALLALLIRSALL